MHASVRMVFRLLDLYCAQGGAGAGYRMAGFEVEGVDIVEQPRNPGKVHVADAIAFVLEHGQSYDAIHASPPCQRYVTGGLVKDRDARPDLVGPTRDALIRVGKPWVIENVPGAPLRKDVLLCGSMFGLPIRRHRIFELGFPAWLLLPPCDHSRPIVGVYGHMHGSKGAWPGMLPSTLESWREAIGADWMDADGLAEAIPPAYTLALGRLLIEHLRAGADAP